MKRIMIFLLTNIAILIVISIVLSVFKIDQYFINTKLNLPMLLVFSFVVGCTGSIISLFISKTIAKWSTNAQIITTPINTTELWLIDTVKKLTKKAGISMPEVAIYEGKANAFATGAFQNSALIAVSTELLQNMNKQEIEAVLGHEITHIANGDMVTMALIQGVINTFVIFLSRIVGYLVDLTLRRNENESNLGVAYTVTVLISQIFFGIGASIIVAWFSRQREFRADIGSAQLLGDSQPMINALTRLSKLPISSLPGPITVFGINDKSSFLELFSTHPSLELRIANLLARTHNYKKL